MARGEPSSGRRHTNRRQARGRHTRRRLQREAGVRVRQRTGNKAGGWRTNGSVSWRWEERGRGPSTHRADWSRVLVRTGVGALLGDVGGQFVQFINDVGSEVLVHVLVPLRGASHFLRQIPLLKPNVRGQVRNSDISDVLIDQQGVHLKGKEYCKGLLTLKLRGNLLPSPFDQH